MAAIRAAQLGAKVALIEKDQVGGTCLNRGCIPTKAIIASINLYEKMLKARNYGLSCDNPAIDLKAVVERKDQIVAKIVKGVEFLLDKNKVQVIKGTGKVLEPGKVEIETADNRKQTADSRKIILATGSSPASIPGIECNGQKFLNSTQALALTDIPKKINIIGGGYIGVEFATIFSALGSEVTIYEALPEILSGVDEEIIALIKRMFKRRKVNVLTNSKFEVAKAVEKNLICVGRRSNDPKLKVNNKMETGLPGIYAVGDLISKTMLAHVAYEQGEIAAENALGGNRTFDYDAVPSAIFTIPEIASVGRLKDAKTGKFPYAALGIAQAKGDIEGFIKVVSDNDGRITGVHIIGPDASNLIGAATIAVKNKLNVGQLAETFQAHPSFCEGLQEAALSLLKRSIHSIN